MQTAQTQTGLEVRTVDPGGFADQAGLRPGDLLLALGSAPIYTRPELWVVMRQRVSGDKLTAGYVRAGERLSGTGEL